MTLAITSAVLCLLVAVVLAVVWRRESRRHGATVPRVPAWMLALLMVALGGGLYAGLGYDLKTGTWLTERQKLKPIAREIMRGRSPGEAATEDTRTGPLARVLQRELARQPESVSGWYALGLLYHQMEQPRMTIKAARKGLDVAREPGQHTAMRLLLARGLIAASGGRLAPEAEEILLDVVERQPDHDGAWTLLAMAASRSDRHDLAERAFQSLLERHGEGELGGMLRQGLERVRSARAEQGGSTPEGADPRQPVTVRVTAAEGVSPGGTLFVFLRRGDGGGKPLAARRSRVEAFPVEVTVRPADWLQQTPGPIRDLRAGARYSRESGAGVGGAGLRAAPVPVDSTGSGPDAELQLAP